METKYNVEYLKILVYIDIWGFREPFLRTQKRKKKKKKKKKKNSRTINFCGLLLRENY